MNIVYVTHEEAQKLKPIFRSTKDAAPWADARESSRRILQTLESVKKDVDYDPLEGYQMILSNTDYDFLLDVMTQMELR